MVLILKLIKFFTNHMRSTLVIRYSEKILHYCLLFSTRLSRVAEKKISPTRLSSVETRLVTAEKRLIRATTLLSRVGGIFFRYTTETCRKK